LLTLVLLGLSLWSLAGFVGQVIMSAQMERQQEELRAENAQVAAANAALATQVAVAEAPAYAETILREQLGYARDGDTVILPTFPQATSVAAQPTEQPMPTEVPDSNWQQWMRALFPPSGSP
jgi:hypothetical protein